MTPTARRLRTLGALLLLAAFLVALNGTPGAGGTTLAAGLLGITAIGLLSRDGALTK